MTRNGLQSQPLLRKAKRGLRNYRLLSLGSVPGKILEYVLRNHFQTQREQESNQE